VYREQDGGAALAKAHAATPQDVTALVEASGLRGRGGGGFPAGRKWRAVAANRSPIGPSTVVVNAAEGEPGAFKDRAIIDANPYAILEGALIAAHAVGAEQVIVAVRGSFTRQIERLRAAIAAVDSAGWTDRVPIALFEGPEEYLYGEETALLEAIDGRHPFPRIQPPFRRGVDEIVDHPSDTDPRSSSAAHVEMAGPTSETVAPPTLASNAETFANVPGIVAHGPEWFRSVGTPESPGTVVCTVSGRTARAGVGEFAMGTPLHDVIEALGGGAREGHQLVAAMSGVANAVVPRARFGTRLTYEDMTAAGSGLGAAGFLVFDDESDPVALAAGVERFLAVESCGQCAACKGDGLAIAEILERLARSDPAPGDLDELTRRLATVNEGARCNLATQQQVVTRSLQQWFPDAFEAHAQRSAPPSAPVLIAPIVDLADGAAGIDERERDKQPDWTYEPVDSGKWPADRLDDPREHLEE
jgi:NADH:ubiquinone oxidoreductase subunit F (NADH-binding)